MNNLKVIRKSSFVFPTISAFGFLLLALCLIFPYPCWGEGPPRTSLLDGPEKLSLMVGESKIIKINEKQGPVAKVELVDPKIAEAIVLTPWQIYISGKTPGITTLLLRSKDNVAFYTVDLEVSPDISRLKEMIRKIFPEEKDVMVNATHDSITLSGTASSLDNYEQIVKLSEPFFPKKVVNLMKIKEDISPISKLKEMIYQILPEEKDIKVTPAHNNITLSGTVSSASNLSQAIKLTESYLPKDGKVVNLL